MTPDQITQIVETIKTLNLNIDSVSMVQIVEAIKPILWVVVLKNYFIGIIVAIIFLIAGIIIYKLVSKTLKQKDNDVKAKEVAEFLKELNGWDSVKSVKGMLQDILEYMPKNKRKRKINPSDDY